MFESIKAAWRKFAAQKPGTRFRQRYHDSRNPGLRRGTVRRVVALTLGVVLIALGTLMLVLPGPGVLVLIVGLGFIAEESLVLAKILDRVELWIRRAWRRVRGR